MEHVMKPELTRALRTLRLPVFAMQHGAQAALAANEGWTFDRYLLALCAFRSCCCHRVYHEKRHLRLLSVVA